VLEEGKVERWEGGAREKKREKIGGELKGKGIVR